MASDIPTVTARLFGGLGNQLFQYAVARALADRTGSLLRLDTRLCNPNDHSAFALGAFNVRAEIASLESLPPDKSRPLGYSLWRFLGRSPRHIRERELGFDPTILGLDPPVYLHGYFQSEKYFAGLEEQLRDDLKIQSPTTSENAFALEEIRSCVSVSMHLRRGDYVANRKGAANHGTCTAEYYATALETLRSRLKSDPMVFVFSDDPIWARENINLPVETRFFDHNGPSQPHEDMRLIAACDHNIIANSTFSWWGAWLNPNPDKVVVAPKNWFSSPKLNNPDIVPEGWLRV